MNVIQIDVHSQFGEFCARGDAAVRLLKTNVYPNVGTGSKIVFDFEGVRNMNSSFSNALFANLVRKFGDEVLDQVQIVNAKPNIRNEIVSSFMLANTEHEIVENYEL